MAAPGHFQRITPAIVVIALPFLLECNLSRYGVFRGKVGGEEGDEDEE